MQFPKCAIVIHTYDRYTEIRKTITALQNHIIYPDDRLIWIISDDATGGDYLSRMERLKSHEGIEHISTDENGGWGVNANNALNYITENHPDCDYVYFTEDDYVLTQDLDLRIGVALLEAKRNIGLLRYRGTAGDKLIWNQFDSVDVSEHIPDDVRLIQSVGKPNNITYLHANNGSPTAYIYSHGPHLKRFSSKEDALGFHEFYGMYPEGLTLGKTEESFALHVKRTMTDDPYNALAIAILPEWIPMRYDHIGQSYQLTDKDKGN